MDEPVSIKLKMPIPSPSTSEPRNRELTVPPVIWDGSLGRYEDTEHQMKTLGGQFRTGEFMLGLRRKGVLRALATRESGEV